MINDDVVELLAPDPLATGVRMLVGEVTDASVFPPLVATDGGAGVATPVVSGYRPSGGDIVQVLTDWNGAFSASRICLGKISSPVGCVLTKTVGGSPQATGGASTTIPWDTEVTDQGGFITPTSTDITIPTGGTGVYGVTSRAVGAGNWTVGSSLILTIGSFNYTFERSRAGTGLAASATVTATEAEVITVAVFNNGATQNFTARVEVHRVA